jgi:hypothetical protein
MHSFASYHHTLYDTRHEKEIYWSCLSGSSPAVIRQLRIPAARKGRLTREDTPLDELICGWSGCEILVELVLHVSYTLTKEVSHTSSILFSNSAFFPARASPGWPENQLFLRVFRVDLPFKIPLSCNSSAELLPLYNNSNFALSVALLGSRS